jgi:bifunctional DNase/RNase
MRCESENCAERAVFHFCWTQKRRCQHEQHLCEAHAKSILLRHNFSKSIGSGSPAAIDGAVCFDIDLVVISEVHDQQVVYLREVGGSRFFPILIGIFEATSLDRSLKGFRAPRPLTHDAMLAAIQVLDGEVHDVVITDFKEHTYFTNLRIRRNYEIVVVDLRPSDAFVMAVLTNKPIFISERVLMKINLQSTDQWRLYDPR